MAITQTDTGIKLGAARNTRRNEIIAIALLALSALLVLCLISYDWTDPSRHTHTREQTVHNWAGVIGSYIAAELFQLIGLVAYLLPVLLIVIAWRRFRKRRMHAPWSRVVGLIMLLLASSALLDLFNIPVPFDTNFRSGGYAGAFIASTLKEGLNTVGASVLLIALAATGLLLVTNFSFVIAYERIVTALKYRVTFLRGLSERYNSWRAPRRERAEMRRAAREEEMAQSEKTGAERVAEFMRETDPVEEQDTATAAIKRAATVAAETAPVKQTVPAKSEEDDEEFAAMSPQPSLKTKKESSDGSAEQASAPAQRTADALPQVPPSEMKETAEIEEMVRSASVVRTEAEDATESDYKGAAERARRMAKDAAALADYKLPDAEFLNAPAPRHDQADEELRGLATRVAEKCREFNVTGKIEYICPGPVVTTYEFKPDPGVKYARVTGLVDDLCLALKAESIRIDRVPGKAHVGIEVPNPQREIIYLREVIDSRQFRESSSKLTIALGKTIDGLNYVADLARMPHLLIAGATGTGKSVCLNSLVVSILYKARPDEVKFILIDPKRLELGLYADIPHLATPIITDPKRAANALKWAVAQMEQRYKELAKWGVRNIDGFNTEVVRRNAVEDFDEEGQPWKPLPYIVIIIDELADLMMVSGHEVEEAITRLAQMARAVGIHLVLATQRPSVDVITGLIKANFPSRIAFRVSSKVDSRTIIDANGAEQLLGRGDMLFLPPGTSRLVRVHGAYLDESEVSRIVAHVKAQGQPLYDETITLSEEEAANPDGASGERDELFEDALRICVEMKRASTSVLQRRLRIGYGRAAAILDAMEREGFIGQADGARPRPVLGRAYETVAYWDEIERGEE